MASSIPRSLEKVVVAQKKLEGGGFPVRRPGYNEVGGLFLLFDHMGPMTLLPGEDFPGPDHPHRGFETISYHLQGWMEHHCSTGHTGRMGPGCCQWMTAGRGVVHGGGSTPEFRKSGGQVEAFQIWVNLPAKDKMIPPRYQDIEAEKLPVVRVPLTAAASAVQPAKGYSTVKIISGSYNGTEGVIQTRTPVSMFDVRLQPGGTVTLDVPAGQVGIAYVYRGAGAFGAGPASKQLVEGMAGQLSVGDSLTLSAAPDAGLVGIPAPHEDLAAPSEQAALGAIVIFGQPINEPIARYGPFVMNTQEQIQQAFDDYRSGRMGKESRVKHEL